MRRREKKGEEGKRKVYKREEEGYNSVEGR